MIKKTRDYSMFKHHPANRPLDPLNVKKIKASLNMNNMLEFRPILVNKAMQIIDGQHRVAAAEALGIDVYYTVQEDSEAVDIVLLNSAQKHWQLNDYVRFYASQGKEHYINLTKLMDKYDLTVSDTLVFMGQDGGTMRRNIRSGQYTMNYEEKKKEIEDKVVFINQVVQLIDEKTLGFKKFLKSVNLKRAFSTLMNNKGFSEIVFLDKLQLNLQKFTPCTTTKQYLRMMISIYNYRNSDPIET